jgi:hypothetical protein
LSETEKLLDSWKHPDPYIPPTAPGGIFPLPLPLCADKQLTYIKDQNMSVTFHRRFLTVSTALAATI